MQTLHLERFERYKFAKDAGCAWRSIKSADAVAPSTRPHGGRTHHSYNLWPSTLAQEAAETALRLGVSPERIELVAEITVVETDPVITGGRVPILDVTVTPKGSDPYQERRYQRIVKGNRDMKAVLAHLRQADESRRAVAARFFFRLSS